MASAAQTLTAGITAFVAGVLYEAGGRGLAFGASAAVMVALALGAAVVAGPERRRLRGVVTTDGIGEPDAASAVTGHA